MKEILLFCGIKSTKVDDEDYIRLCSMNVNFYCTKGYAEYYNSERRSSVAIHRIVMKAKDGEYVDHIDKDTLNNQKYNLRICTNKQNIEGKSKAANGNTTSPFK